MPRTPEAIQRSRKTIGPKACKKMTNVLDRLEGAIRIFRLELEEEGRAKDDDFDLIDLHVNALRRWLPVVECCVDENSPLDPAEVKHEAVYGEKVRIEDVCNVPPEELIPV